MTGLISRNLFRVLIILTLFISACSPPPTLLQKIQQSGELLVITRNSPTTFYEGPDGPAGIEYELVKRFANSLKVKPRFIIPDTFSDILPMIVAGEGHIAAAGLTVTEKRRKQVRFSTPYQMITQQVVYRSGNRRPRKKTDLLNKKIEVIAGSSHDEALQKIRLELKSLKWKAVENTTVEKLLQRVDEKLIDYAIADSNDIAINRRYYPRISIGFNLTDPEPLAWALTHSNDNSLYNATIEFFEKMQKSGELKQLIERYYGHVQRLNFVDKRTFWRHIKERLPKYRKFFQEAAKTTGYDWRLLAAIGYQESHWNPKAVSPTGVRGIMMLTRATARQLGIKKRTSAKESILGGARYLKIVEKKIPERIRKPDRIWLSLAGYNIGFGHLEDARILTERKGGNPDKWLDVKQNLPLLSIPAVYKTLRHGYARGKEPVDYVDNIRNYYDLLLWKDHQHEETQTEYQFPSIPAIL